MVDPKWRTKIILKMQKLQKKATAWHLCYHKTVYMEHVRYALSNTFRIVISARSLAQAQGICGSLYKI